MGAYENPEAYIDTQSGQYYRKLQETITKTVADIGETYYAKQATLKKEQAENMKMLKANDMKAQEYAFSLYTDLSKSGAGDTSVNWARTFDPLITESVSLRTGLMNGTIRDKQGAVRRLAQIQASVDGVTGSLANLSAAGTAYKTAIEKGIGAQGGLGNNDIGIISAMDVLTGRIEGSKEPFFKDNDPNQLMWRIMGKNKEILKEFNADDLDKISKGQGLIRTIPSQVEAFDSLKVNNTNIFGTTQAKAGDKETVVPTGRVTDAFLVKGTDGKPEQTEVVVSKIGNKTTSKLVYKVNTTAIKANLDATLQSQAEGMLTDENSAIEYYNHVITQPFGSNWKGLKDDCFDAGKPLKPEEKKKFIENYKSYFAETQIAPTQDVLREDSSVVTNTVDTTKKDTSGGDKGVKPAKPLLPIEQVNEFTAKYDKLVNGETNIIKLPTKAGGKMFRYNSKTGKVYETNAAEEILDAKVDRATYREYLGVKNTKPGLKTK